MDARYVFTSMMEVDVSRVAADFDLVYFYRDRSKIVKQLALERHCQVWTESLFKR